MRLFLGEPRRLERGVERVVVGTEVEEAFRLVAGFKLLEAERVTASARMNLGALLGVPSMFFDRFDGDKSMEGSTFSES